MKKFFFLFFAVSMMLQANAQNFLEDFNKYTQEGDTAKTASILQAWSVANPKDSELFPAYFNFYYAKSRQEILKLINNRNDMETGMHYQPEIVKKGIMWIDKGIALYPNRLDYRLGKAYVYSETEDWNNMTQTIIEIIRQSNKNKNAWTWTKDEVLKESKAFMLSSVQTYQLKLYNTEDDLLLKNMQEIAREVLKVYPDHVESLTNMGITYILGRQYDLALQNFEKAHKVNDKDCIVLNNLAYCYQMQGDALKAIVCYKKILEVGGPEDKADAEKKLKQLSK